MRIHLVDGTYELFRSFFGAPPKKAPDGREVGATLGLLNSLLFLLSKSGATHVACAFDHVIESFRNDLFLGYKTSTGVAPDLLAQFPLAEEAVAALGWSSGRWWSLRRTMRSRLRRHTSEANPASTKSSFVPRTKISPRSYRATGWSVGTVAEASCMTKRLCWRNSGFGPAPFPIGSPSSAMPPTVSPGSRAGGQSLRPRCSPVTNTSSLFPKTMANGVWGCARALRLAESLRAHREEVLLYRRLATLRRDVPLQERIHDLEWHGAQDRLKPLCRELGGDKISERVPRWISTSPAT